MTASDRVFRSFRRTIPQSIASCMGLTREEFAELYALTYKALKHMESNRTE